MNLKQIIQNVSDTVKRKRGMKNDEEPEESSIDEIAEEEEALTPEQEAEMEIDSPEGSKSMLKGDHGKIFGLSKPVVIGVGAFFLVVFMLAFIYASSSDSSQTSKNATKDMKKEIAEDTVNGKDGDLVDDYGELHRANEKKKTGMKTTQNGQNSAGTVHATRNSPAATAPASSTVSSAPQISQVPRASVVVPSAVPPVYPTSYARNYSLPSQEPAESAPAPEASPAKQATSSSIVDKVKESLSSAIAFFGGSSDSGSQSSGGTSGSTASTPTDASQSTDDGSYYAPASDNTITAGTLIPAMLLTGINSDVPGQVAAQIMADVYDTSGTNLLIPAGSRIIGKTGTISADTGRVGLDFDTIVLPDGSSWNVGNSFTAVDGGGYSGIQGVVHNHTGANIARGLFRSALSALSTINVDRVTLNTSDIINAKDSLGPTTTVEPGYQFQIYATKNIAF